VDEALEVSATDALEKTVVGRAEEEAYEAVDESVRKSLCELV
jgi:hypothetical protein